MLERSRGAEPVLYGGSRSIPRGDAPLCRERDRTLRPAWDEAGEFPRELYEKAAEIGLLGLGFPEEYGGVPADQFMKIIASQELARAGAGGVSASLMSHTIGSPPIARAARPRSRRACCRRCCPARRSRRWRSPSRAAAPTSPICAPPRAAKATIMSSTARRLSSPPACAPITHRRGADRRRGRRRRQPAADRGRYAGPVANAAEEDGLVGVGHRDAAFRRLPRAVGNLIGEEGQGFKIIMQNFNSERMGMAAGCIAYAARLPR